MSTSQYRARVLAALILMSLPDLRNALRLKGSSMTPSPLQEWMVLPPTLVAASPVVAVTAMLNTPS